MPDKSGSASESQILLLKDDPSFYILVVFISLHVIDSRV